MSRSYEDTLQHFSHEHSLNLSWYIYREISCSLCNRSIRKLTYSYQCDTCHHYYLHKECATAPEHMEHPLHPPHRLLLSKRSLNSDTCCYYCEEPFLNDEYVYACNQLCSDNFYMHISCALIPLPTIRFNVDGVLQHVCHEQPMTLVEHELHRRGAKCFACQSDWSGSAYACISKKCKYFIHKSCVENLRESIRHPFHPHHSLILHVSKPQSCRSCCKKDCRLVVSCREHGCDFNLCIDCTSLNTTVKCRSHHHLLALVEKSACQIQCDACQKTYKKGVEAVPDEVSRTRSLLFRCMDCVFNFHFLCGPLPSAIKYEYHIHNLILSDHSSFKDDSEEYYCDACEEEMDLSFRISYCEECKFAAHVHCLIHEIMKIIKGDNKDVELKALGEDRWGQLGIESTLDPDDQSKELTLDKIMNMLTESEKNNFFDSLAGLSLLELLLYPLRDKGGSRFISCQNLKGSIEDADRLRHFFTIDDNGLYSFREELRYSLRPGGDILKLADKYLQQKVQNVDGYMVPITLAPILKTLLHKYGDLKGHRNLPPAMRSIGATLLCIVIEKMCRTKVEDLTWEDLKHYNFHMQAIGKITGFEVDRYLDDDFLDKAFFGCEAIRYETMIREKMDSRIAELETVLKRLEKELETWKVGREKLETYASQKSDVINECLREASKWKHRYCGDIWF